MGELPDLTGELKRHFGYPGFRPGQEGLIQAVLQNRDALGILPTGGGKSVCFQLPAFLMPGMVLVVSPLISLMEDQTGRARDAGLRADFFSSATPDIQREGVLKRALDGETDLLLVAPERFHVPAFRKLLPRLPVSLLAVDEAHCISHWGHDFRPAYLRIGEVRSVVSAPVMALTATATPQVREEMEASLFLRSPHRVVGSFDRPNLGWEVQPAATHGGKIRRICELLRGRSGASIVYASTRRSVEAVRRALASRGILALAYHAGLSPGRRSEVQRRFLGDRAPVVVATNAFGMGIDRPDVRLVLHYQLSGSLEAYYQEAGRGGRDGDFARCVALHGPRDDHVHEAFSVLTHPSNAILRKLLKGLRSTLSQGESLRIPPGGLGPALGFRGEVEMVEAGLQALARAGAVEITTETLSLLDPDPDLTHMAILRAAARDQLRAVARYAQGGKCRRRIILEYFGEERVAKKCGLCDWCLGGSAKRRSGCIERVRTLFEGWIKP